MGSDPPKVRHGELPLSLTPLVGRQQDISELCSQIQQGGVRLLTITGVGGVGKTSLALAVASTLETSFDQIWLVELAGLREPDLVVQEIALTLGIREEQGHTELEALSDALANSRTLLLLDNCEHLLGAVAYATEFLARHSAHLVILLTSRQRLNIPGEVVWLTRPLAVPDESVSTTPDGLLHFDAVQLFAQRARQTSSNFTLDTENAPTVARICRLVDGVPLAINLAARWVTALTLKEMATLLEDRFRLLMHGRQIGDHRHETLRRTVEWSHDLLQPEERILFRRMAAFQSGCSLAAIEFVCADEQLAEQDLIHLLMRLIDASLVMREEINGQTRYRMLETLRLFAHEQLVLSGDAEPLYRRHAKYYLDLAETAEPELWGPNLGDWLPRLELEHENLRAALRWATGRGEVEFGLRLATSLGRFWRLRGHVREGLRWIESALSWNPESGSPAYARALDVAGHLARDSGSFEAAERFYARSLALNRESGDQQGTALALNNLATVSQFLGNVDGARRLFEESLSHFQRLDDRHGVALTLVTLGTMAQLNGDIDGAKQKYHSGLDVFRELNERRGIAATLNNLGNLTSQQQDHGTAEAYYRESLELFRELGDELDVASCLTNLAQLSRDQNDLKTARMFSQESLRCFAALQHLHGVASCLSFLADTDARLGNLERAVRLMGAATTVRETLGITTPVDDTPSERLLSILRARMSQEKVTIAWNTGRAFSITDALADATEPDDESRPSETPATLQPPEWKILTPREREVVKLIARGLTNRQIAETLYIAERTADTHVEHILSKLDVHKRAEVAAWAVTYGLATIS